MIIECRECGHGVSTEAAECPSCGYPQRPATPAADSAAPRKKQGSRVYGWIALTSFLMSNFIPAIVAPLVLLTAFIFSLLEINRGGKLFGGIMVALCVLQVWFIADHFGGLSGTLGITNPQKIEKAAAAKYSATDLNVPLNTEQIIDQNCEEEWPNDFRMRSHCEEQQRDGVATLNQGQPAFVSNDAFIIIRGKCAQEWPRDFRMRVHCESQQYEGYRALQVSTAGDPQKGRCAQQWPNDYRMRQYCERKR